MNLFREEALFASALEKRANTGLASVHSSKAATAPTPSPHSKMLARGRARLELPRGLGVR